MNIGPVQPLFMLAIVGVTVVLGACTTPVRMPGAMTNGAMSGCSLAGSSNGAMGPGMMGPTMMGPGILGNGGAGTPLTLKDASHAVETCLQNLGGADLAVDEVMEFNDNFYAIVKERATGTGAFELLVNKPTGAVFPEPGPNMMWSTKYGMQGHMAGYPQVSGPMTVSDDQATQIAQRWLDQSQPGSTPEKPDVFYGYYTIHILKGGAISGMLSVSGYTGQVWYHTWHGAFIGMEEMP